MNAHELPDLLDWKRRIFSLYADVRDGDSAQESWQRWRDVRDELWRTHPQSPVPPRERSTFGGLAYFDYDPVWRTTGRLESSDPQHFEIPTSGEVPMSFERVAHVAFEIDGAGYELEAYWLDAYGGGLFLPFADATSGKSTYGAGRYLYDTVKGADLGSSDNELVLDFNFAYNPSCAYDTRWVCPLAPAANRLPLAVEAGEKTPTAHEAPGAGAS